MFDQDIVFIVCNDPCTDEIDFDTCRYCPSATVVESVPVEVDGCD